MVIARDDDSYSGANDCDDNDDNCDDYNRDDGGSDCVS